MAPKVINRAKPLTATHAHCGAVIEYYPIDVTRKHVDCAYDSNTFYLLECPNCLRKFDVGKPHGFEN